MMIRFPLYDCLQVENFIWYSDSEVVPLSLSFSKFCHVALSWIKLDKVLDAVSSSTNRISSHPSHTSLYSKRSLCWINFIHYTCIHSNLLIAKLLLKPFTMYVYYCIFHFICPYSILLVILQCKFEKYKLFNGCTSLDSHKN